MRQVVISFLMLLVAGTMAKMSQMCKTSIMDKHNEYRKEQRARYMNKLEWDNRLEDQAESYVSNCRYEGGTRGYNTAFYKYSDDQEQYWHRALSDWYNEKNRYELSSRSCGYSCNFTQMVWYNTKKVGCAQRHCDKFYMNGQSMRGYMFFACVYNPVGNNLGEVPYSKSQTPCEDCSTCEKGLCVGGPKQCYDFVEDCQSKSKACKQSYFMRRACMKTCGFC